MRHVVITTPPITFLCLLTRLWPNCLTCRSPCKLIASRAPLLDLRMHCVQSPRTQNKQKEAMFTSASDHWCKQVSGQRANPEFVRKSNPPAPSWSNSSKATPQKPAFYRVIQDDHDIAIIKLTYLCPRLPELRTHMTLTAEIPHPVIGLHCGLWVSFGFAYWPGPCLSSSFGLAFDHSPKFPETMKFLSWSDFNFPTYTRWRCSDTSIGGTWHISISATHIFFDELGAA